MCVFFYSFNIPHFSYYCVNIVLIGNRGGINVAVITGKNHLFFVTSPRTPFKMIDEVKLLVEKYQGQNWNKITQEKFASDLYNSPFFGGASGSNDKSFSARDRITRAPKALGFVDLKPTIQLTPAGNAFIYGKRPHEIFTRQLLKFQLPSPYHTDTSGNYYIKPYLELLRMVYELDGLSKDEIALFFTELTNIQKYQAVKDKILKFRHKKRTLDRKKTSYKRLLEETFTEQILYIYENEIKSGNLKTRETETKTIKDFVKKKRSNHLDYADAAIRYMRSTILCTLQPKTFKLIISPEKTKEVEFILKNVDRNPIFTDKKDTAKYKKYLFDASIPTLYTDDINRLESEIKVLFSKINPKLISTGIKKAFSDSILSKNIEVLKDIKEKLSSIRLKQVVDQQVTQLKSYGEYNDIQEVFDQIKSNDIVDRALFFEWNVWRSMTMLNDGEICGNFKMDDDGMPLTIASGNLADITCEYQEFNMTVEVTLSTGQKQYEMEGEPVARHLSQFKQKSSKETYCLFVAGSLNDATLAHFYYLHKVPIHYYGGTSKIIPLSLDDFRNFLEAANSSKVKPNSKKIHEFMETLSQKAHSTVDEKQWYRFIKEYCKKWAV